MRVPVVFLAAWAIALIHAAPSMAVEAGPILSSRHELVILGDSYSAGEGADVYLHGTDTAVNPCHRSPDTYLVKTLGISTERIVACSGAVINDVYSPQKERTVVPQVEQLNQIRDRAGVDAVFLTLGGNDAGFAEVAESCIVRNCAKRIYTDPFALFGRPSEAFVNERLAALPDALRNAYLTLNYAVNGPEARRKGGPVPIFVLAYPFATPEQPRPCPLMYEGIKGKEIEFLDRLGARLNDTIESTVSKVRESDRVPIFFVRDTETAFRPDHSLCDKKPYARTLKSFDGAGRDSPLAALGDAPGFWQRFEDDPIEAVRAAVHSGLIGNLRTALLELRLGMRELCHPNQAGYAAISRAVLNWSQGKEARQAARILAAAPIASPPSRRATLASLEPGTVATEGSGGDGGDSFVLPLLLGFAAGLLIAGAVAAIRTRRG